MNSHTFFFIGQFWRSGEFYYSIFRNISSFVDISVFKSGATFRFRYSVTLRKKYTHNRVYDSSFCVKKKKMTITHNGRPPSCGTMMKNRRNTQLRYLLPQEVNTMSFFGSKQHRYFKPTLKGRFVDHCSQRTHRECVSTNKAVSSKMPSFSGKSPHIDAWGYPCRCFSETAAAEESAIQCLPRCWFFSETRDGVQIHKLSSR